jgi:DNA replication and repair protein RecF
LNVFSGGNGAGKTSLLEAIYFLGRGRSFRTADRRVLIRSGAAAAELSGKADDVHLGIRIGTTGLDIRVAGQVGSAMAELVSALAVQAIPADMSATLQGPPVLRRRLLDWGLFHVEHRFLEVWRQFRRAIAQRNAALRSGQPGPILDAWDAELVASAERVDAERRRYLERIVPVFRVVGHNLVGIEVDLQYDPGWPSGEDLSEVLRSGREGDRAAGFTRAGPHRADLRFQMADAISRGRASEGQTKLIGAAFVLAQCRLVSEETDRGVALAVDEPAADLDSARLAKFIAAIEQAPVQAFVAAIDAERLPRTLPGAVFHVEHGEAKALL